MKKQAETFVQKNYKTFTDKNMILVKYEVIDHGDAGKEYLFIWNEMVNDVYTPSAVMISVLPDWDNSIIYNAIDCPLLIDTTPKVLQDAAQETALQALVMGSAAEIQSTLRVIPYGDSQKLVWIVETIQIEKDKTNHGGTVFIDAISGEILSINPLQ